MIVPVLCLSFAEGAEIRRAATLKQNQATVVEKFPQREQGRARDKAAEMIGANPHYVTDAKKIERDAPEVLDYVKQGKLSIPEAKGGRVACRPTPCGLGLVIIRGLHSPQKGGG